MMQIIPMTVEQALKASETYASPINGDMMSVLAAEIRRLQPMEAVLIDIASGELGINLCIKYARKATGYQSDGEVNGT
jgi:hypothetical protein